MATTCELCSTLRMAVVNNHMECLRKNIPEYERYRVSIKKKDEAEALVQAARIGSHQFVRELIEAGADVNLADDYGETALTASIQSGHDRCVHMLIEAEADMNMTSDYCFKKPWPLMCAVVSFSEEYVNVLIKAGVDVNQTSDGNTSTTALSTAASYGYHSIVEILIKAGADVNAKTRDPGMNGMTPLLEALNSTNEYIEMETRCFKTNFKPELCNVAQCVSSLIQTGTDVNIQTVEGFTPLIKAVETENAECLKLLIDGGADVNMKNNSGNTALMKATEKNNKECIDLLLNLGGAYVNIADNGGCTILMKSVSLAPEHLISYLEAGADVNATDCFGYSAFMYAAKAGNLDALKILGDLGNINRESNLGSTALILAAENGNGDCVNYLVKSGADVNIHNRAGATALHRSAAMGHVECVNELIKAGADVNITDIFRNTALIAAAETGSVSCIKVLLKAGALINQINNANANALQVQLFNTRGGIRSGSLLLYAAGERLPSSAFVTIPEWLQHRDVKLQLKHICRQVIRKHLLELDQHQHLFGRIPRLGLPRSLMSYLLFEISLELEENDLKSNPADDHGSDRKDGSDDYGENGDDNDSDDDVIDDDVRTITESDQCKTQ